MGLLDEAIREHLELKRRRGADPGEVAREQREALDVVAEGDAVLEPPEAPAPEETQRLDAPATQADHEPLASTLAAETAELDMQSVLAGDDLQGPATPVSPDSGESAGQVFYTEAADRDGPAEDDESPDVYRQVPGQERLSFE